MISGLKRVVYRERSFLHEGKLGICIHDFNTQCLLHVNELIIEKEL